MSDGTPPRRRRELDSLRTASEVAWRVAVIAAAVVGLGWLVLTLRLVTVPAFIALLVTAVLQPLVNRLRRRGWPDLAATWAVLLGSLLLVTATIALLVPPIVDQAGDLGEKLDGGIAEIEDWLETGPVGLDDPDLEGSLDEALSRAGALDPDRVVSGISLVGEVIAGGLLALVMAFFFVKDGPMITAWVLDRSPARHRARVATAATAAWTSLGAYVRGTAIVGLSPPSSPW